MFFENCLVLHENSKMNVKSEGKNGIVKNCDSR